MPIRKISTEPPWSKRDAVEGELILRGRTKTELWGFGQHPSTSLCLSVLVGLLGDHGPGISTVVELASGSGLLFIAASRLGAKHAIGIESDPELRAIAEENIQTSEGRELMDRGGMLTVIASPDELDGLHFSEYRYAKKLPSGITGELKPAPKADVDLAIANLTAPELHAQAELLAKLAAQGHLLIAGFTEEERESVEQEFIQRGFRFLYREVREGFYATVLKSRAADAKGSA